MTIIILDVIHRLVFYLKQRFGDWILSPSSDGTYSVGPNRWTGGRDLFYLLGPPEEAHLKTDTEYGLCSVACFKLQKGDGYCPDLWQLNWATVTFLTRTQLHVLIGFCTYSLYTTQQFCLLFCFHVKCFFHWLEIVHYKCLKAKYWRKCLDLTKVRVDNRGYCIHAAIYAIIWTENTPRPKETLENREYICETEHASLPRHFFKKVIEKYETWWRKSRVVQLGTYTSTQVT
jgi:hypothetical protein